MEQIINSIDFNAIIGTLITAFVIPILGLAYKQFKKFLDTKEQEQLSELQITLQEIPDYFFGKELWS